MGRIDGGARWSGAARVGEHLGDGQVTAFDGGSVAEERLERQGRPLDVLAEPVHERQRVGHGLDLGDVDGVELRDVSENGPELTSIALDLLLGEAQSRQFGDVADRLRSQGIGGCVIGGHPSESNSIRPP